MATSSLEELKARIAAGEYAIDSRELAGRILSTSALIKRVKRLLTPGLDAAAAGRDSQRLLRRVRCASHPLQPRPERLQ